jgi:D-lyxose ketol-isomerase
MLKTSGTLAGLAALSQTVGGEEQEPKRPGIQFDNADFYDSEGNFQEDKAKAAVVRLCQYHGYPVFPGFADNLWVTDYATGKFAELGLAAYVFVNNEEDRYMMLDIFLFPNQMLPEHWHVAAENNPAKMEGWLVRWGISHIVGIGEPNLSPEVVVPKCHWDGRVTTEHAVVGKPGMFVPLAKVNSRHWQFGGPEGGIVTEVANVHTNAGVRHTDPKMNEFFLKMVGAA